MRLKNICFSRRTLYDKFISGLKIYIENSCAIFDFARVIPCVRQARKRGKMEEKDRSRRRTMGGDDGAVFLFSLS